MIVTVRKLAVKAHAPSKSGLTDVFVCKFVRQAYSLWLMLDRLPVNNRLLKLFNDSLVNGVALPDILVEDRSDRR